MDTEDTAWGVVLDGRALTGEDVVRVACDRVPVVIADSGRRAAEEAHAAAQRIVATRPVYGRTTGVGANRVEPVGPGEAEEHGKRLLRSHAGGVGDLLPEDEVRAMLVIRLNQILAGGAGLRADVADALASALNQGSYPAVHEFGAIGTGDLTALSETGLALLGELPWLGAGPGPRPIALGAGDALALISSNALTIGIATLAYHRALQLLDATHVVAALSFLAVDGSLEAYAERVHANRPHDGQVEAAARMRELLGVPPRPAARLQDPFGFRCFPQVHGPALDAAARLSTVLGVEINAAAENPLISAEDEAAYHHGGFHCAHLRHTLDGLRLALLDSAHLSTARLSAMLEPRFTGLRPFLAEGASGSSGVMILEYSANSALAEVRSLAAPAGLGNAVVSRGLEEHSSFAYQSARQTLRSLTALRLVLASELVTAVRALRQRGIRPGGPLEPAYDTAAAKLSPEMNDRQLSADVEIAAGLIGEL